MQTLFDYSENTTIAATIYQFFTIRSADGKFKLIRPLTLYVPYLINIQIIRTPNCI